MKPQAYPEKHHPNWALYDVPFHYREVKYLLNKKGHGSFRKALAYNLLKRRVEQAYAGGQTTFQIEELYRWLCECAHEAHWYAATD